MYAPTISQYADSLCRPYGLYRTLGEPECERNVYGEPVFIAGGNAVVFKIWIDGTPYALKCYTRPGKNRERIYGYLRQNPSGLLYETGYLPRELYVYDTAGNGKWHDVLLMEWSKGATLAYEVRRALHYRDRVRISELAYGFDRMAYRLLSMPWAHGDLKPGNITVDSLCRMRLLDYDAMFLPLPGFKNAAETGTPQYNHPERNAAFYCKGIDDYPVALISSTLHILACDISFGSGCAGGDMELFQPQKIMEGNDSTYADALVSSARKGDCLTHRLLSLLESRSPSLHGLRDLIRYAAFGRCSFRPGYPPEPFFRDGKWGYRRGEKEIIPPLYDSALDFTEGLAATQTGGFRHFIDAGGRTVINCAGYEHIKPFSGGVAAVKDGREWKYIDHDGYLVDIVPAAPPGTG